MTKGDLVVFADPFDHDERETVMVILEDRGDRALIGYIHPSFDDWPVKPVCSHPKSELKLKEKT